MAKQLVNTWEDVDSVTTAYKNALTKETITATASQTVVTFVGVVNANSMIFVNGFYVDNYTITSTHVITFPYGLNEFDKITKK